MNIKEGLEKKLVKVTGCVKLGCKKGEGFLAGAPPPSDHSCHQSSLNLSDRILKIGI